MPDKDRKSPLPEPPKNPLEFIQDLDSAIKNADDALRSVDKNLRNFDDQLNSTPKELATKRMRRERGRPKTEAREPTGESYEACYRCSFEHLGEVQSALDHASGREPGSEEYESKIERAMDKLLEIEREHLGPKDPSRSRKIRRIRKDVESHLGPGEPEASLAEIEAEVKEIRPEMKGLWKKHAEEEGTEEAYDKIEKELERFFETEDVSHLDKAEKIAEETKCSACKDYLRRARKYLQEGKWDEAEKEARRFIGTVEASREIK